MDKPYVVLRAFAWHEDRYATWQEAYKVARACRAGADVWHSPDAYHTGRHMACFQNGKKIY